ncbi:BTAD domain-containing putative transcriptional regulator [Plantactinospora endophytica]|uniref:SARP family transcriptional regulator n=1 Tax=Plantactinospora endophytica TaxID=673535 RepID=A0ABQ4E514_9ACTN|nr:BTAD domain-containing putative transcriptional regulator [Plantactinospora endophytica]GIG89799.1 SARP family transcriptional regulator [Plantactinospora endophytica]
MRFGVLGPLAVWTDHGEPVTIPGRKVRALLADLLVGQGRPVSVDRLVEDLWGTTPPADPTAALHVRVSQLRRALAGAEPDARDLVVSQAPGYELRTAPDAVDAGTFTALVGQAQATDDPRTRAGLLADALALWRGGALADFADEEFARTAVARWEEQRLTTVEAYAEARLDLGEHGELVGELAEQVTRHPYRERLRAAHLRALHRSGRTGEALDSFQELRRGLADELGLDPGPELAALHRAILAGDPAENAPAPARRRLLPSVALPAPVTELIGREHAVRRVRELLAAGRLVTLTGPGGVGKTSVALAVARTAVEAYPDGVWLVDLTSWDGSGDPAEPVLAVLSIPDAPGGAEPAGARLAAALRERRMLLVLDNCEHVIEPVAGLVGGLLPAAPGLRVLATSREPLRLRGEARWDLPPLDLPDTDDPDRLARSSAVRLFLARAGLAPTPETVAGVAEVCRRLDGIPLALELAATRVPVLGVPELAARLRVPQDRFGLLATGPRDAPARQRTLAAVIDWSWRLLGEPERALLRRLAVHSGGCTLTAAETVCADPGTPSGTVLDLLAGLVDRSLVVRGDGPRFRLLESVSAYCLDRLREAGEETAVRRRHADHYLALAERADPELRGPGQREWLRRLDAEAANLRAALDTFRREGAAEPALRLATALVWYRFLRGRLTEARRSLAAALAVPGEVPDAVRATAEAWHAGLAMRQGQAGPEQAAEVLRGYEKVADPLGQARAEWFLAASIIDFGDVIASGELLARALETFRAAGDRWGEAAVLSTRAMLAHWRADPVALEADARRGAELFGELGDDWGVLQATDWLIGHADLTGDWAEAARLSRDGQRIAEELGLWSDVAGRLAWLAWISTRLGDYPGALEHAEQARRLAAEQGLLAGEVFATIGLAYAARRDGRLDLAEQHLRWLLASARQQQTGDAHPPYLAMVLIELGMLAGQCGDPAAALAWHQEAFDVAREQNSPAETATALTGMADALVRDARTDGSGPAIGVAAQLLGAADAARRGAGHRFSDFDRAELDGITEAVRAAAGADFATLFARGGTLSTDQARSLLADRDRA